MPRPKKLTRPVEKTISIPEDVVLRVDLELFSEVEQRVPHGAWARLVTQLLRNMLAELDKGKSDEQ